VPRGATVEVLGAGLSEAFGVEVGGVLQPDVEALDDGRLRVGHLHDATPLGLQPIVCTGPGGTSTPLTVEVVEVSVLPRVLAHGSAPRVSVTGLSPGLGAGPVSVRLGGVPVSVEAIAGDEILLAPIEDALPTGLVPLEIQGGDRILAPLPVTLVHLVINEVDCDTPSTDTMEFVEVAAGRLGLDLAGYVLVFFNGGAVGDASYFALSLAQTAPNETTSPNGTLLLGNALVVPPPRPAHRWPNGLLMNGSDAVALYQGTVGEFPAGTLPTRHRLIDAVVYGTDDAPDLALLQTLLGTGPEAVQVDEHASRRKDFESVGRVAAPRLDGRVFRAGKPSPWGPNQH